MNCETPRYKTEGCEGRAIGDITGGSFSDHMQLPLEPQKALHSFFVEILLKFFAKFSNDEMTKTRLEHSEPKGFGTLSVFSFYSLRYSFFKNRG